MNKPKTIVTKRPVADRGPVKVQRGKKPDSERRNMRAPEREKLILESAIRFFAEHGFEGQTRDLAKRIGITHSAIYRHFPSKEVLIERAYEHVYLGAWQQHWSHLIHDKSQMLEARLIRFYREYADQIFKFDWVRIFIFSGLKSFDINHRYLVLVMERIGRPALIEARQELGFVPTSKSPISPREQELFWGPHGRIFYIAIRKFVHGTPVPEGAELQAAITDGVRQFMLGAHQIFAETVPRK